MLIQVNSRQIAAATAVGPTSYVLRQLNALGLTPNLRPTVILTGSADQQIAAAACQLLDHNIRVILHPPVEDGGRYFVDTPRALLVRFNENQITSEEVKGGTQSRATPAGDLVMFTSGSTGASKKAAFTNQQLDKTLDWYRGLYSVDEKTVILSSFHSTYNFALIAGALLAHRSGAQYYKIDEEKIPATLEALGKDVHVVILANPLLLERLRQNPQLTHYHNVLIDCGGAPLSKASQQWFRGNVAEICEGYGLTETASLTHFDAESGRASIGSVGRSMEEVSTTIKNVPGVGPTVWINSPNLGMILDENGDPLLGPNARKLVRMGQWFSLLPEHNH